MSAEPSVIELSPTPTVERHTREQYSTMPPDDLVRYFADDVWRYVASKLRRREDVEDVVMEVFGAAFKDLDRLRKADSPRLWLLVVARRKVIDVIRRSYRKPELPLDMAADQAAPEVDANKQQVYALMDDLPEIYREVLILKYVNGLGTEEVARVIRKSVGAANSLLQRARQSLREKGLLELPWLDRRDA
ncbi:MAG: sigma-70 family RNA polymerase sigma factor [Fimbriimonadaceae bacterium]|nr:sigma-70 family RNA polymerase sigma factor [Fimbriimonadaceae bacterium]